MQQESALARRSRLPRSFALMGQRRAAGDPDCHCCMRRGEREVEGRRGESAGERDSGYTGERPGVIALEVHEGHRRYGHSALPFQTRPHSQIGSLVVFVSILRRRVLGFVGGEKSKGAERPRCAEGGDGAVICAERLLDAGTRWGG